jgi:hypothetical protein
MLLAVGISSPVIALIFFIFLQALQVIQFSVFSKTLDLAAVVLEVIKVQHTKPQYIQDTGDDVKDVETRLSQQRYHSGKGSWSLHSRNIQNTCF